MNIGCPGNNLGNCENQSPSFPLKENEVGNPPMRNRRRKKKMKSKNSSLPDVFGKHKNDGKWVVEYLPSIMKHYRQTEGKYMVPANFLQENREIDFETRKILVDWLIDVHSDFDSKPMTLFLGVGILDRFCHLKKDLRKKYYQLVGITALQLASKREEVILKFVEDICKICANTYTQEEIRTTERNMCILEQFSFTMITPMNFLRIFLETNTEVPGHTKEKQELCEKISLLLCIVTLLYGRMVGYKSSLIAASSIYIASKIIYRQHFVWRDRVESFYIGYQEKDLTACVRDIVKCLRETEFDEHEAMEFGQKKKPKLYACFRKFMVKEDHKKIYGKYDLHEFVLDQVKKLFLEENPFDLVTPDILVLDLNEDDVDVIV